ncbi:MAG TPA: ABC transporter permease, partial [Blastocatellia bacterium]|nr:ABC transporter permease [Blastocatellia bacterium]
MTWWRRLWQRGKMEDHLQRELAFHLDQHIKDLIEQGHNPDEARRLAGLALGGQEQVKEKCRDARGTRWFEELAEDIRYAARRLRATPGFTAVVVLTLALGIGANTAIFSVVRSLLLQPFGLGNTRDAVLLNGLQYVFMGGRQSQVKELQRLKAGIKSIEDFAAYSVSHEGANLTGGTEPERVSVCGVTENFFDTLKVTPFMGRAFRAEESDPGANHVVMLSYRLWRGHFGSDTQLVGRLIQLNGRAYTVAGIAPPEFEFPLGTGVWVPLGGAPSSGSPVSMVSILGRITPGVALQTAQVEMDSLRARQKPAPIGQHARVAIVPLKEALTGDVRPALVMLSAAVLLVLLIACINVANLLLVRAATRSKDVAIRLALGAGRRRLVQLSLVEALLISLLSAGVGLLLAIWGVAVLKSISPHSVSEVSHVRIDASVLAFTAVISIASAILFGLLPAIRGSRADLTQALKQSGQRSRASLSTHRLSKLFVTMEVAISLLLLAGAGLLVRSFIRLSEVQPGYDPAGVSTMCLALPDSTYPTDDSKVEFYRRLMERVRTAAGVDRAGVTSNLPLGLDLGIGFPVTIEGRAKMEPGNDEVAFYNVVSPGYFSAMGIRMIKGNDFTEQDHKGSQPVVVINRYMANRFWPDREPLGQKIQVADDSQFRVIVGVVDDVKTFGLEDSSLPMQTYVPLGQGITPVTALAVRSSLAPKALVSAIGSQVHSLDPNLPLYDIKTMTERLASSSSDRRFNVVLLGIFAVIAVVIAAIGLYGVLSHLLAERTHEIGIRMAVGARRQDILKLAIRQGIVPAIIGIAVGLGGSLALSRLMTGLLFGITPNDPVTLAAAVAALALV